MNDYSIKLLEGNLVVLWIFTSTEKGCLAFVDSAHDMENGYPPNSEEREIVRTVRDLAFAKGNLFALGRRQEQQLKEGQEAWAGDYNWNNADALPNSLKPQAD